MFDHDRIFCIFFRITNIYMKFYKGSPINSHYNSDMNWTSGEKSTFFGVLRKLLGDYYSWKACSCASSNRSWGTILNFVVMASFRVFWRIFLRTSETSPRMATGKTIPSGFCSDGLGDEELQDERMILPKTTNKMIEAIFNRKSPRMLIVLGYSD